MSTKIEWCDETWTIARGCSMVSRGCQNCYAQRMAHRFSGTGKAYEGLTEIGPNGPRWNGTVRLVPESLGQPLRWKKPRRVFVGSMTDLFHEDVPNEYIAAVFGVMAACPQHVFQVLTKRAERLAEWFDWYDREAAAVWYKAGFAQWCAEDVMHKHEGALGGSDAGAAWPLPNVWLGVSVEDQATADERIPHLLDAPAAVRFISAEPLLGPIDLAAYGFDCPACANKNDVDAPCPYGRPDWIIAGGESGPGARPMHPDWARSIRDQCSAAGVAFFFKQNGAWGPGAVNVASGTPAYRQFNTKQQWINKADTWVNGGTCVDSDGRVLRRGEDFDAARYPVTVVHRVGKNAEGRLLDGRTWDEMPEVSP